MFASFFNQAERYIVMVRHCYYISRFVCDHVWYVECDWRGVGERMVRFNSV